MDISNQNGFTLVEALVVVIILGILASIAIPSFAMSLSKYRTKQAAEDIVNIFKEARSQAALSGKEAKIFISPDKHTYEVQYIRRSDKSSIVDKDTKYITNRYNISERIVITSNIGNSQSIQPTGRLSTPSSDLYFRICDDSISNEQGYSVWINAAGITRVSYGKLAGTFANSDCS